MSRPKAPRLHGTPKAAPSDDSMELPDWFPLYPHGTVHGPDLKTGKRRLLPQPLGWVGRAGEVERTHPYGMAFALPSIEPSGFKQVEKVHPYGSEAPGAF